MQYSSELSETQICPSEVEQTGASADSQALPAGDSLSLRRVGKAI